RSTAGRRSHLSAACSSSSAPTSRRSRSRRRPPCGTSRTASRHKAAAQTIKGELGALGRCLTLAWIAGYIPKRPRLPVPRVSNARQGFFEEKEFRAVLKHLPEHLRPVAEFAYYTGWRHGEVFGLQWRQVDFAGTIRLEPGTTKNDEARTSPSAR